jgi:hypothetical protein
MITGMHVLLFSRHAQAVQRFFSDVLEMRSVDAGDGWPIFAAPPAALGDDVRAMKEKLAARGIETEPIAERGWGLVTTIVLPGGERLGLYEPQHPSPLAVTLEGRAE